MNEHTKADTLRKIKKYDRADLYGLVAHLAATTFLEKTPSFLLLDHPRANADTLLMQPGQNQPKNLLTVLADILENTAWTWEDLIEAGIDRKTVGKVQDLRLTNGHRHLDSVEQAVRQGTYGPLWNKLQLSEYKFAHMPAFGDVMPREAAALRLGIDFMRAAFEGRAEQDEPLYVWSIKNAHTAENWEVLSHHSTSFLKRRPMAPAFTREEQAPWVVRFAP